MKKDKIYLVDFDGTITKEDTLTEIAALFFPNEYKEWGEKLMSGIYSIKEWLNSFQERFDIKRADYDMALDKIEIDHTFKEFLKEREVKVVSGGFDYNIERVFKREGIDGVELYANILKFEGENKIKIDMKYFNENCGKCGVCKRVIVEEYKKSYENVIFIGDGITDLCAAEVSTEVYSKKGSYLEMKIAEAGREQTIFSKFSEVK